MLLYDIEIQLFSLRDMRAAAGAGGAGSRVAGGVAGGGVAIRLYSLKLLPLVNRRRLFRRRSAAAE